MNRKLGRRWRNRLWAAIVLLLPLLSACGAAGTTDRKTDPIDAPPPQIEAAMLQQSAGSTDTAASPEAAGPEDSVTVYLLDRNGYLAPMTLHLSSGGSSAAGTTEAVAKTALTWLTQDPRRSDQLPAGFTAVVPEGMTADMVKLDTQSSTVSIDFAAPLTGMTASKERKMIEALVWTMTEFPGIDKVRLSVAGKPISMLPSSGLPLDEVLTRGFGINLEPANGVQMTRSMAVTLYFAARSDSGDSYFVPVTRLIARSADRMGAALDELIKGPDDKQALQPVLTPGVTVEKLSRMADTVNLSLHEDRWSRESVVPSEMMEALVLTMTETTGAPQLKVTMNGDDSFLDSDQRSYDQPVTRPTVVNVLNR
jgi:germination protein M